MSAKDASNESYYEWWDGNTHHVVHGTKGSIENLKKLINPTPKKFMYQIIQKEFEAQVCSNCGKSSDSLIACHRCGEIFCEDCESTVSSGTGLCYRCLFETKE